MGEFEGCRSCDDYRRRWQEAIAREAALREAMQSVRDEIVHLGKTNRQVFDTHGFEDELAGIDLAIANPSSAAERLLAAQRVCEAKRAEADYAGDLSGQTYERLHDELTEAWGAWLAMK